MGKSLKGTEEEGRLLWLKDEDVAGHFVYNSH